MTVYSTRRSLVFGAIAAASIPVFAQGNWPQRPIRIVAPFAPGGAGDTGARGLADGLTRALGQPFVVDNKPGGGGAIGAALVAKSPPDGYTLLAAVSGVLINSLVRKKLPYAIDDLVPVAGVNIAPSLILVDPALPVRDLRGLQAFAKAEPRGVFFGTGGAGSTNHFTGELIRSSLEIPLTFVHYKGGAEAIAALHSKQVQVVTEIPTPTLMGLLKTGKVRALAVTSDRRDEALPGIPSTSELGFPQIQAKHWMGLMAPKLTPPDVLDRINSAAQAWLATDDARALFSHATTKPLLGDRKQFAAFIAGEVQRFRSMAQNLAVDLD